MILSTRFKKVARFFIFSALMKHCFHNNSLVDIKSACWRPVNIIHWHNLHWHIPDRVKALRFLSSEVKRDMCGGTSCCENILLCRELLRGSFGLSIAPLYPLFHARFTLCSMGDEGASQD